MSTLTPKQALFVAEYLVDQNGKQAAIRAGYSAKTAEVKASQLLRLVKVKSAVAQRLERVLAKVDLRVEDVLFAIQRHVLADGHADAGDFFDEHNNLKNIRDMSPEARMNIGGFEVVKRNLISGDGKVDEVIKVKARDQSKYVELGAKYFGLLVDKVEHTHLIAVADGLSAGRDRSRARSLASQPAIEVEGQVVKSPANVCVGHRRETRRETLP